MLLKNPLVNRIVYRNNNKVIIQKGNKVFFSKRLARSNIIMIRGNNNALFIDDKQIVSNSRIEISGNRNSVKVGKRIYSEEFWGNTVRVIGNNNSVEIGDGVCFSSCNIFIVGNNNSIQIGRKCSMVNTNFHMEQNDNTILINEESTFHGRDNNYVEFALDEGTKITIGEDCMISNNVRFRSSDSHSIVDFDGKRINFGQNISIANHTWICMNTIVLKGFINGSHSVIAAGSVCSKPVKAQNVIIGGNPAMVIKSDINWKREFVT